MVGIVMVVAALFVVTVVAFLAYKIVSSLPQDDRNGDQR